MNVSQVHEFVQQLEDVKVNESTDTTTSSSSTLEINNTSLSPADK